MWHFLALVFIGKIRHRNFKMPWAQKGKSRRTSETFTSFAVEEAGVEGTKQTHVRTIAPITTVSG